MAKILKKKGKVSIKARFRKRVCVFCQDKKEPNWMDYAEYEDFLSVRGGLLAAKVTSVCSKHQRMLTKAVKNARHLGLLPFVRK